MNNETRECVRCSKAPAEAMKCMECKMPCCKSCPCVCVTILKLPMQVFCDQHGRLMKEQFDSKSGKCVADCECFNAKGKRENHIDCKCRNRAYACVVRYTCYLGACAKKTKSYDDIRNHKKYHGRPKHGIPVSRRVKINWKFEFVQRDGSGHNDIGAGKEPENVGKSDEAANALSNMTLQSANQPEDGQIEESHSGSKRQKQPTETVNLKQGRNKCGPNCFQLDEITQQALEEFGVPSNYVIYGNRDAAEQAFKGYDGSKDDRIYAIRLSSRVGHFCVVRSNVAPKPPEHFMYGLFSNGQAARCLTSMPVVTFSCFDEIKQSLMLHEFKYVREYADDETILNIILAKNDQPYPCSEANQNSSEPPEPLSNADQSPPMYDPNDVLNLQESPL